MLHLYQLCLIFLNIMIQEEKSNSKWFWFFVTVLQILSKMYLFITPSFSSQHFITLLWSITNNEILWTLLWNINYNLTVVLLVKLLLLIFKYLLCISKTSLNVSGASTSYMHLAVFFIFKSTRYSSENSTFGQFCFCLIIAAVNSDPYTQNCF